MEKLPAEQQKEFLVHAQNVSKLERPQLLEAVAELQLKQPEGAAMADHSGAEGERQLSS